MFHQLEPVGQVAGLGEMQLHLSALVLCGGHRRGNQAARVFALQPQRRTRERFLEFGNRAASRSQALRGTAFGRGCPCGRPSFFRQAFNLVRLQLSWGGNDEPKREQCGSEHALMINPQP